MFKINLGSIKPYPEQFESAKVAKEAIRATITMPTGTGKSIAIALLVNELQLRTLIIVPNLTLKKQLSESLKQFFGSLNNIVVENIDSTSLQTHKDFDLLILDESHRSAASTYLKLNKHVWNKIYYRAFFTASPYRSREEEQLLYESITGPVVYRVKYEDAVAKKYIVPLEAFYYELPKIKVKQDLNWQGAYSQLVVKNEVRNKLIASLLSNLHSNGLSTLCLVKEIAHGEDLVARTGAAFATAKSDDCQELIEWFSNNKIKTLIGINQIMSEGVDSRPAEYIVIAGLGKSRNQFVQQVGRGFRNFVGKESCKVILFYDPSHKWTISHFKEQAKFLREEFGIAPTRLDLPEGIV